MRVIGAEKHVALRWDEGATYFTAIVGADGYVLQVWIDAREASGGGDCLLVGGVDASGGGVDDSGILRVVGAVGDEVLQAGGVALAELAGGIPAVEVLDR